MRAVSPALTRTLRGSHKAIFRAKVCTTLQVGTQPTGTEIPILGGDVTTSATSDVRATLNLTTNLKWPNAASDLLAPYGNEIFVERGVDLGNGQHEWCGLGYYRIDTPQQDNSPDGPITLSCPDRWQGIIDGSFPSPRQFLATMTRRQLVDTLIGEVYPTLTATWDDNAVADTVLGRGLAVDSDRAGTITNLVTALGKIGYFKYDGSYRIETPPLVTGAALWTVNAGRNGVMVRMSRALTRQGVYNIWPVESESADSSFPVRYVAADYSPNSPTRVDGRFGPVPAPTFRSSAIITTAQARLAAEQLATQNLGLPYSIKLGAIVHPGLEPYDVIDVAYPQKARSAALVTERHVCDNVTIPLTHDVEQSIDTRQQPVVLIGPL
jgi:hypothetical protein